MTFVLAPLDYRRSTETVKTIVERLQQSFGAGFQPFPKYGEPSKGVAGKSDASLEGKGGWIKNAFEAGESPHTPGR